MSKSVKQFASLKKSKKNTMRLKMSKVAGKLLRMHLLWLVLLASVSTTLTSSCAQDPFPVSRIYRVDTKYLECDECRLDVRTGNVSNCKAVNFTSCGGMAAIKVADVPLVRAWVNRQLARCESGAR